MSGVCNGSVMPLYRYISVKMSTKRLNMLIIYRKYENLAIYVYIHNVASYICVFVSMFVGEKLKIIVVHIFRFYYGKIK